MASKNKIEIPASPPMNHVRAFVFEATMTDAGVAQLTQALGGFLRTAAPTTAKLGAGPIAMIAAVPVAAPGEDGQDAEALLEDDAADAEIVSAAATPRAPAKPRVYPSPDVLDIDLESGGVSWPDFAAEKQPGSLPDKYLVAAAWLKLHRNTDAVSMSHIYTCFLHPRVSWSAKIDDFEKNLRYLKSRKHMGKAEGKGLYAINHLGLAEVREMGKTAE